MVPLHHGALVWCRDFPVPEQHFKCVLLSGDSRLVMTMPCLHKWGKWLRASSYKQGKIAIETNPETKRLEASCLLCTFNSIYSLHPQGLFAQESHPCLFPTLTSPIIMAKTPMSCLFLSEHWCVAGSFLCLKCIPNIFSVTREKAKLS